MAKLCKVLAVIILISGIVNSIFLAITPYGIFNIASVLAECLTYIATFALLYGFGTLLDHARRIDQNISRLVDGQTEKKEPRAPCPPVPPAHPRKARKPTPINTGSARTADIKMRICPAAPSARSATSPGG